MYNVLLCMLIYVLSVHGAADSTVSSYVSDADKNLLPWSTCPELTRFSPHKPFHSQDAYLPEWIAQLAYVAKAAERTNFNLMCLLPIELSNILSYFTSGHLFDAAISIHDMPYFIAQKIAQSQFNTLIKRAHCTLDTIPEPLRRHYIITECQEKSCLFSNVEVRKQLLETIAGASSEPATHVLLYGSGRLGFELKVIDRLYKKGVPIKKIAAVDPLYKVDQNKLMEADVKDQEAFYQYVTAESVRLLKAQVHEKIAEISARFGHSKPVIDFYPDAQAYIQRPDVSDTSTLLVAVDIKDKKFAERFVCTCTHPNCGVPAMQQRFKKEWDDCQALRAHLPVGSEWLVASNCDHVGMYMRTGIVADASSETKKQSFIWDKEQTTFVPKAAIASPALT